MQKVMKVLNGLLEWTAISLFFVLVLLTLFQVLSRYALSVPIAFGEEVGRFLFIWISFLGAAIVMRHDEHMKLDVLQNLLSPRGWIYFQIFSYLLVALFSLVILSTTGTLLHVASRQTAAVSRLSMGIIYSVLPISSGFTLLYSLIHLFKAFAKLKGGKP